MPFVLIAVAALGGYLWWKNHQTSTAGATGGSSGTQFLPSPNTVYYLAVDNASMMYFQADPNWQVQTAADGTPAIYTGSSGPTSGPAPWLAQLGVQTLAVAMWVGGAGSAAAPYVTSYGPMVSF